MKPVDSITLSERAYNADRSAHRHEHAQALFPQRGALHLAWRNVSGAVHGAQVALVPPDIEHAFWSDGGSRCLVIDIPADVHDDLASGCCRPAGFQPLDDRLRAVANALALETRQATGDMLTMEALGLYAASVLIRGDVPPAPSSITGAPPIVREATAFLRARAFEPVTIVEIARAVGVSSAHLQRCFRAELGGSVVEYVHRLRLEEARSLLSETELSVLEIAHRIGFASQSHLSRLFRREVGISPSQFRVMSRSSTNLIGSGKTRAN